MNTLLQLRARNALALLALQRRNRLIELCEAANTRALHTPRARAPLAANDIASISEACADAAVLICESLR